MNTFRYCEKKQGEACSQFGCIRDNFCNQLASPMNYGSFNQYSSMSADQLAHEVQKIRLANALNEALACSNLFKDTHG